MRINAEMMEAGVKAMRDAGVEVDGKLLCAAYRAMRELESKVPEPTPAELMGDVNLGDAWLRFRAELNDQHATPSRDVWLDHVAFCREHGVDPTTHRTFSNWLLQEAPSVTPTRGTAGRRFMRGIRLKPPAEPTAQAPI